MAMSTQVRTSNQSRASTKIVIGFLVLMALGYFGKNFLENRALNGVELTPVTPSKTVNIVGVDTTKGGYHIVVANGLAQLVQSPNGTFGNDSNDTNDSDDSGADKKRVPLKELIETLQGNSAAVGQFVATLNDMKQEDLPAVQVAWKSADVLKAIAGDNTLKTKLEEDLNTHLDGTPLPEFRPKTFQTGIVIHVPVTMDVTTTDGPKEVTGDLLMPFQTTLMRALEARVKDEANLDEHKLSGFYAEVGKSYIDQPTRRQKVGDGLKQLLSKTNIDSLTQLPQTVLDSVQVLVTDSMMTHASYTREDTTKGTLYNINIDMTDEGRKRLWKYSKDHLNDQLLLVDQGVAVAALKVGTELAQSNVVIQNMPDENIVQNAVNDINNHAQQKQ